MKRRWTGPRGKRLHNNPMDVELFALWSSAIWWLTQREKGQPEDPEAVAAIERRWEQAQRDFNRSACSETAWDCTRAAVEEMLGHVEV